MEFDHPGIRFKMEVTDDSDAFATPLPPVDAKVEANEELSVDDMSDSMSTMSRHLMDFSDHHDHREASGSTDGGMVVTSTANSSMDETDAMPPPPPLIDVIDSVTVTANKEESQIEPQTRVRSNTWPLPRLMEQEEEEITSCHTGQLAGAIGTHAQQLYQPHTILQQHHYSTPMTMQIQFQAPSPLSSTTPNNQQALSNAVTTIGTQQQQQQQSKKNSSRRNAWGNMSYADLITQAIGSTPDQRLTLSQIYDWMVANIPYFKDKGDSNSSAGWKNSIRHNLSLHNRFVRVQNEGTGKSSWWMINPDAKPGKSARRRSTSMETSKYEKKRGRVKKKVDGLRNGLVVTPDTGSLCSASPASSVSEGLDMFPDSPLHAGGHPFQLSPSFRPRAASDASSCGRLSPISGALEPDSAGGWTAGIVSRATLFSHMPPPLISSASSAASSSSSLSTALAAAAAQHHQQQNMIDQQQLVDNMADGMKIRQESSPPTPVGLYHHQQPSPSSFGEYQGKLTPGGSQVLSGSSPNPGDMGQTVSYSLTSLQAVSPMPSVSPSHPTSTTPGCQDMVSSTPGYSPGDPTSAATTPTGGASAGMSPRGTPNLQRHEAGFYHLATAENGAAALMGEAMGVALAYSQNGGGSGSSAGATSAEIDLNLDSFPDPLDCNVDELIKHELRMDGSLDFAFNGHYHHHHHHHAAQLHHHQAAYGAATAGANGQFVQFMAQQPVMIQHSNGSAFAHHYPAFNYHHHQLEPMSSDTSFPVVQSFIGAPPSSQGSAGTPHPISPSASRSWVR